MELPEGAVAFLFSDIEGSTRLWENDPSGMRESLAEHDAIVQRAVRAAGGHVFKHTGDGTIRIDNLNADFIRAIFQVDTFPA